MTEVLSATLREAFALIVAGMVPVFAAVAVVAALFGVLAGSLGIRDGAVAQIVRALAVILALGMILEGLTDATVAFAVERWSGASGGER